MTAVLGGGWCPKGVFRNRGKMEENRYSLVAGKSRVERAERGRRGDSGARKREIRARSQACAHTRARTHTHLDPSSLGSSKTIPGKTPKIRRYETT